MMKFSVLILIVIAAGVTKASPPTKRETLVVSKGLKTKSLDKRQTEYLTKAEFNAGINDFMFTLSGVARDIAKNMETLNQASADLEEAKSDVSTLQGNYDTNTVKQCQDDYIRNACDSHSCESAMVNYPNYFSPYFKTGPAVISSIVTLEDHGGTPIRVRNYLSDVTTSQMTLGFQTWGGSQIDDASLLWMACA